MKVYEPSVDVVVTLPFRAADGSTVVPTALSYKILDEAGTELVADTAIVGFDASKGEYSLTVPDTVNDIGGERSGMRIIEMSVTTASDIFLVRDAYILEVERNLVFSVNSFLTYEQALLVSREMQPLNGWSAAEEDARKSALMQAFDHLNSFYYHITFDDDSYTNSSLRDLEADDWASMDTHQLADFRKAQVIQADYLLGGRPIERDIEQGLQSHTVGESSQFFRPRASLVLPICRDALKYVGRYIRWSVAVGRA